MYDIVLAIHNILRWAALLSGVAAFGFGVYSWLGKKEWAKINRILGIAFTSAMDIQLLLGVLLYFVFSEITKAAFRDFGSAMSNTGLRFFAIEHAIVMLLSVVFAHLGSARSKMAADNSAKHKGAVLWFGLALLAVLAGMPWFRPLFPGL